LKAEFEALGKSLLKSLRGSLDIIHRLQLVGVPPNLQEQLMLGEQPDVILERRDKRRIACLNDLTKLEDKVARLLIPLTYKIRVEFDQVVHDSHARYLRLFGPFTAASRLVLKALSSLSIIGFSLLAYLTAGSYT
jgi:hypothetical protein